MLSAKSNLDKRKFCLIQQRNSSLQTGLNWRLHAFMAEEDDCTSPTGLLGLRCFTCQMRSEFLYLTKGCSTWSKKILCTSNEMFPYSLPGIVGRCCCLALLCCQKVVSDHPTVGSLGCSVECSVSSVHPPTLSYPGIGSISVNATNIKGEDVTKRLF